MVSAEEEYAWYPPKQGIVLDSLITMVPVCSESKSLFAGKALAVRLVETLAVPKSQEQASGPRA